MATIKTLFQHDSKPTWFENIAYRPSTGTLLATNLLSPTLTHVDPSSPSSSTSILTIPSVKSLTGICHIKDDLFAIGAGDYALESGPAVGSFGLYVADLSVSPAKVDLVVKTDAGLINGIDKWDENTILVTDCSAQGKLLKVNLSAKTQEVALDEEEMGLPPNPPFPIPINGVKVFRGQQGGIWIYWTNTVRQALYRIPVTKELKATGPVEKVASGFVPDDFVLTAEGVAYVAVNTSNTLVRVEKEGGEAVVVAGRTDALDLAGITAVTFGGKGEKVLYASTSGANAGPVNGTETEPAKVVEIQLQ